MREFTHETIVALEGEIGRKLHWAAIDHHNTSHPHVHVVIRTLDKQGQELHVNEQQLAKVITHYASEVLMDKLGYRLVHEEMGDRARAIRADRWTQLDAEIQRKMDAQGVVHFFQG